MKFNKIIEALVPKTISLNTNNIDANTKNAIQTNNNTQIAALRKAAAAEKDPEKKAIILAQIAEIDSVNKTVKTIPNNNKSTQAGGV